ncbi:MAG: hypothetical protein JW861_09660 [Bacteroidales bacterium]|nr:hypothetical protein [Bacteroidales bacterium]
MSVTLCSFHAAGKPNHRASRFPADWRLGINGGTTSFYGDLSVHDKDIIKKFTFESGPGASGYVSKYLFRERLAVSGQILLGSTQAETVNQSFRATIFEYNLHLSSNLVRVINPYGDDPVGFFLFAGVGHFFFDSRSSWKDPEMVPPGGQQNLEIRTTIPEFVYFFGGQVSVQVTGTIGLTAGMGIRQARNDKLDTKRDTGPEITWDYYLYTSVGVSYSFNLRKKQTIDNWEDPFQKEWEPKRKIVPRRYHSPVFPYYQPFFKQQPFH